MKKLPPFVFIARMEAVLVFGVSIAVFFWGFSYDALKGTGEFTCIAITKLSGDVNDTMFCLSEEICCLQHFMFSDKGLYGDTVGGAEGSFQSRLGGTEFLCQCLSCDVLMGIF